MGPFGRDTTGIEVVEAFRDQVEGKTIVLTGPTAGGLGGETLVSLANANANPYQIILLGRSAEKVAPVIETISKLNDKIKTAFVAIDLNSQESVRRAASEISSKTDKIDILINNAGIMAIRDFQTSEDGIESQFATNYISHFLLTNLLIPKLLAAKNGARIVNVVSDGYLISSVRLDDVNFQDGKAYDPWSAYGQSKTASILYTQSLAGKLNDKIKSFSIHPGVIFETSLGNHVDHEMFADIPAISKKNTGHDFVMGPVKTLQQGVSTTLVAALDPALSESSGAYLENCAIHPVREYAKDPKIANELWKLSERLVGQSFEF